MRHPLRRQTALAALVGGLLASHGVLAQDSMDDVLGGFDELDNYDDVIALDTDSKGFEQKTWDPSGSLSLASSYNLKNHRSSTGTDYDGLSKLRLRLNLGLDHVHRGRDRRIRAGA